MSPTTNRPLRLVIVGGVAGGATAAARARRLSEDASIVLLERGPYISFANCGLPYHVGGVIPKRESLLVQTVPAFTSRFAVDVRVGAEVVAIDRGAREVTVKTLATGALGKIPYDKLILSTGAMPIVPPVPGADLPSVCTLRTIPDMDRILARVAEKQARHATVIGGGYVGLEMAEALRGRGLAVAVVEMADQVMAPVDPELAALLHAHLRFHGVDLRLKTRLTALRPAGERTVVEAEGCSPLETDLVIMAIGVRPESELAKAAGLTLGARGGVVVDDTLRTSDPDVYAVGDVVEVTDVVTGAASQIPLAGPANRQARIAIDNIFGRPSRYRGTLGTAICKVFDLAAGCTGASEKTLKRLGSPYRQVTIHPFDHAHYYPGACRLTLKILFHPETGKLLGAQAVGAAGVDKRVDVLATALTAGMTVYDLEHLELAYAPPYGSARDPVNMAGMVAANILRGDHAALTVAELAAREPGSYELLDVREPAECQAGTLPGARQIPMGQLRDRLDELPKDKEVVAYCQIGQRGYVAQRLLSQKGLVVTNLLGGYRSWASSADPDLLPPDPCVQGACGKKDKEEEKREQEGIGEYGDSGGAPRSAVGGGSAVLLDCSGLQCPGPLMAMQQKMAELELGRVLQVSATDPGFPADAAAWARRSGHEVLAQRAERGTYVAEIRKGRGEDSATTAGTTAVTGATSALTRRGLSLVVFSNDLDRALAAMIIANGAAAMGMPATLFFTFWGLNVLRKDAPPPVDKTMIEKAFGMMMPRGPGNLSLSKMHMAGMGTAMMRHVMEQKHVPSLPELIEQARRAGVRFVACTMSMDVMGIKREELLDGVELGGVAAYLEAAGDASVNLFI